MKNSKSKIGMLLFLFFSTTIGMHAQDLIVTDKGDSINCKITKIKTDYIYFIFKHENEIRSTLLPTKQVKQHQYAFYQTAAVPADFIAAREEYPRFRMAINGGLSYRLAKTRDVPSGFEEYAKDLKSGGNFALDASYYFSKNSGVGLKYSTFKSKGVLNNVYTTYYDEIQQEEITQYGKMSDAISINFIGPFFSSRFLSKNKKNCFLMNIGLGYISYKNDEEIVANYYTLKGSTVGVSFDIGYDIGIVKNLALGFQTSYMGGSLFQYELTNNINGAKETIHLEKNTYDSLARLDFNIGLRFNK